MFTWITDLKKTPSRIAERREALSERRKELTHTARKQLKTAAGDSQERLWALGATALERVDAALDRTDEVPVVGRLSKGAHKVIGDRLDALTAVPVDEYDALNAKEAISAIRDLESRVALAAVRRHEAANKNRKTVLAAVESRVSALA